MLFETHFQIGNVYPPRKVVPYFKLFWAGPVKKPPCMLDWINVFYALVIAMLALHKVYCLEQ